MKNIPIFFGIIVNILRHITMIIDGLSTGIMWTIYLGFAFFVLVGFLYKTIQVRYDQEERDYVQAYAFKLLYLSAFMLFGGLMSAIYQESIEIDRRSEEDKRHIIISENKKNRELQQSIGETVAKKLNFLEDVAERASYTAKNQQNMIHSQLELIKFLSKSTIGREGTSEDETKTRGKVTVEDVIVVLNDIDPRLFNTSGWQRIVQKNLGDDYFISLLFSSPAFRTNEPYIGCDCNKSLCGLPKIPSDLNNENNISSLSQVEDVVYLAAGRHDIRYFIDNTELAKRRAACVALRNNLPIERTVVVGAPYRQVTETGNVTNDRRVDVFVLSSI